jgi:hypothetical protein
MKEAQDRIKEGLAHILGIVSFEDPNRIKIYTAKPKLTKKFFSYIGEHLLQYQDMIDVNLELMPGEQIGEDREHFICTLDIYPTGAFPAAVRHLPHIVGGFEEEYKH